MKAVLCSKKRTNDYLQIINKVYVQILIALAPFQAHSKQYKKGFFDAQKQSINHGNF